MIPVIVSVHMVCHNHWAALCMPVYSGPGPTMSNLCTMPVIVQGIVQERDSSLFRENEGIQTNG